MLQHFSVHSPRDDHPNERVTFRYKTNDREGDGYLSRTTLDQLAKGQPGTPLEIFDRYEIKFSRLHTCTGP